MYETVSIRNKCLRKDTFSYEIDPVLIPIRYGQIRILIPTITGFHPCLIFYNNQSLIADFSGPVNSTRTGTDITDKIRIVTVRTDKYGSHIRSVRSVRKCSCDLSINPDVLLSFKP